MKAGRELDALVAEKVLGCKVHRPNWYCTCLADPHIDENPNSPTFGQIFAYSTDIAAAWSVVERFPEFTLRREPPSEPTSGPRWRCTIQFDQVAAYGDTAPEAICIAALKAVGAL